MSDMSGLFDKFLVFKRDGVTFNSDYHVRNEKGKNVVRVAVTGDLVDECFVLRPTRDRAALKALFTYATNTTDSALSNDLIAWIARIRCQRCHGSARNTVLVGDNTCPECVNHPGLRRAP